MSGTKTLKEMSGDELRAHLADLRKDFSEVSTEGERSDADSAKLKAIHEEAERADFHLMVVNATERRQAEAAAPEAFGLQIGSGIRSAGELVFSNDDFKEWVERSGLKSNSPEVTIEHGIRANVFEWGSGGPLNASTGNINTLLPVGQPIAPAPRRGRLFMRDLIPTQRTTLSTIPYVRELAPVSLEGGASAVAEGATKPDQSIQFQGANAPITVIAGNITVSKQIFEDAQTVMDYINGRLPYLVQIREDAEILAGDGTWPNIQGLKNVTGVQTGTVVANDASRTIAGCIAQIENADGSPTAVVMNPTDAWAMFTKRASTSGVFDAGNPFTMGSIGDLTVWGLPVKRSRIYAVGQALVGDFVLGAILFDREQVNVQAYPQHGTYPIENKILLQAEERVGLAVPRPDLFVSVTGLTT